MDIAFPFLTENFHRIKKKICENSLCDAEKSN
jgi:hypothetical protein